MCYSAQVAQVVRKLHRNLGIRLDYAEAERLFFQRLEEPTLNISRGFEANFSHPTTEQGRRIRAAIETHRERTAAKLEKDLFLQKTRLADGRRSLEQKATKRAREDVRIAAGKIEAFTAKLGDLRRVEPSQRDDRVFPMMFAGVIVRQHGEHLLTPMRYGCRPEGKPAFYDKKYPGLYNARRDSLNGFWSGQFGRQHAILLVDSFYENVRLHAMQGRELRDGESERNVVLQFTPHPAQTLYVACLWSHWKGQPFDLRSFAAITDEPPADVAAAGHDRCIVNLRPEQVEAWLSPEGRSMEELQRILSDRDVPVLQHAAPLAA